MRKILREPLFHFILLGSLLFALFYVINPAENKEEIIIDTNLVTELTAKWGQKRNRQPTLNEIQGLISEYLEQEIFYREALKMNLDHNDEIVKRRLAQKMEFISDELAETLQPTDKILENYYTKNKKNYSKPPIYNLQQVYFNTNKRPAPHEDALDALKSDNPTGLGDAISLPKQYQNTSGVKLAIDFGTQFSKSIDTLKLGTWAGPIQSGLGVHIVKISSKKEAGFYSFEEVKNRVNIDYNFKANNDFKNSLLNSLLENYEVVYDLETKELVDEK